MSQLSRQLSGYEWSLYIVELVGEEPPTRRQLELRWKITQVQVFKWQTWLPPAFPYPLPANVCQASPFRFANVYLLTKFTANQAVEALLRDFQAWM
jgi:hypothetical protein